MTRRTALKTLGMMVAAMTGTHEAAPGAEFNKHTVEPVYDPGSHTIYAHDVFILPPTSIFFYEEGIKNVIIVRKDKTTFKIPLSEILDAICTEEYKEK